VSFVKWNDEEGNGLAFKLFPVLGIGFGLAYFFGGYRLLASIWVRDDGSDVVWWPVFGPVSVIGVFLAVLGMCGAALLLKRLKASGREAFVALSVVLALAVGAVGLDSLQRVEVRGDGVSVRHHGGTIQTFSTSALTKVEVGCLPGRRGSPRPAIVLLTGDGSEVDLASLHAIAWNGPPREAWLAAVERVTVAARQTGVWEIERHPEGRVNLDPRCVARFAERFPVEDRTRVIRLFSVETR
jgi:uncharacterized membrane protein YhaH (DUF805 family)